MIKTKITDYKSEVEKNDELQLQNVSLDNKMNMLKTLIESFGKLTLLLYIRFLTNCYMYFNIQDT